MRSAGDTSDPEIASTEALIDLRQGLFSEALARATGVIARGTPPLARALASFVAAQVRCLQGDLQPAKERLAEWLQAAGKLDFSSVGPESVAVYKMALMQFGKEVAAVVAELESRHAENP